MIVVNPWLDKFALAILNNYKKPYGKRHSNVVRVLISL